jgi:hypothetical protein
MTVSRPVYPLITTCQEYVSYHEWDLQVLLKAPANEVSRIHNVVFAREMREVRREDRSMFLLFCYDTY